MIRALADHAFRQPAGRLTVDAAQVPSGARLQKEFMMQLRLVGLLVAGWVLATLPSPSGAQDDEAGYRVKPGDILRISVWGEEALQGEVLVAPDGAFSFPLVGHVNARGRTAAELQQTVSERLAEYIASPVVTVSIAEINGNKIYVIGQVTRPGVFVMNPSVDVMQALSMAGGTTPFANLDEIRVLRRRENGQVALPFQYQAVIRGRNLDQNIQLESGDVVVVP
jgi:polysaccharide export outer membrane protein